MKTALNAYAGTPHKTIGQLVLLAGTRTLAGENPDDVIQDIVDGYGLGWGSVNAELVTTAAWSGAKAERSTPMRRTEQFSPGPWRDCGEGVLQYPDGGPKVGTRIIEAHNWGRIIEVYDYSNESDANFRLILAAPELYAALEELEAWATARENTMGDPSRIIECQAHIRAEAEKARALLDRVNGGAN